MRFSFLFNEVLTGFRRNVTMTVAMILTTAISIGLFGGGLLVVRLADHSRSIYLDRVETQVFLTNDVSANDMTCESPQCKALREKIEKRNDVKSVRFLNRQDAYNDAIRKIPQFKDLASKDAFPASFIVKLENPEQHAEFDAAMQGQPGVDHRAQPEGADRPALRGARRVVQRRLRRRAGAGGRGNPVDCQHGSGRGIHPTYRGRHHATGRRHAAGTPSCRSWSRRCWRRRSASSSRSSGLIVVRALFLDSALSQFYQAHLIAKVDYADILYIAPLLLLVGVAMAGVTSYATLRLYVRR